MVCGGLVASASVAATGPVDVPSGKLALRASDTRQILYTLGSGFTRYRTINGSITTREYGRRTKVGGGRVCTVVISGVGRVVRTAPDAGSGTRYAGGPFVVSKSGTSHGLHWATGTDDVFGRRELVATTWRRTLPADRLGRARGWLAFDVVARDADNQGTICSPLVLRERDRIARAARSFTVIARP